MTTDYRTMCAELVDDLEMSDWPSKLKEAFRADIARARALLDQPVAEGPTDEELLRTYGLAKRDHCYEGPIDDWPRRAERAATVAGLRAVLARWGNSQGILDSSPQPEGADIHYAWELHDAEGEWQAGGSANSLNDVEREGNRYLQTYSQDGHHKLIIQRHCVTTIEEATNV